VTMHLWLMLNWLKGLNKDHSARFLKKPVLTGFFLCLMFWFYMNFNPIVREFCQRLKANGKNGKAVVCDAMRKLIHLSVAVLKSGKAFDTI